MECLVIEDTAMGVKSAKSAKMKCVLLSDSDLENFGNLKPDIVVMRKDLSFEKIKELFAG